MDEARKLGVDESPRVRRVEVTGVRSHSARRPRRRWLASASACGGARRSAADPSDRELLGKPGASSSRTTQAEETRVEARSRRHDDRRAADRSVEAHRRGKELKVARRPERKRRGPTSDSALRRVHARTSRSRLWLSATAIAPAPLTPPSRACQQRPPAARSRRRHGTSSERARTSASNVCDSSPSPLRSPAARPTTRTEGRGELRRRQALLPAPEDERRWARSSPPAVGEPPPSIETTTTHLFEPGATEAPLRRSTGHFRDLLTAV